MRAIPVVIAVAVTVSPADSAGIRKAVALLNIDGLSAVARENPVPKEIEKVEQEIHALSADVSQYCPCDILRE